MKSEMRVQLVVAVAALADEHAGAATPLAANRAARRWRRRRALPRSPTRGAVGGDVHRARQGADPSALRELPSGRRSPAPGRPGRLHQPPVERGADGYGARGDALLDLPPERQFRARPHAGPSGMAPRAARNGVGGQDARRDLRADQGSRAQWRPLAAKTWSITSATTRWSAGPGRPASAAARSRHAKAGRRAGRGLGENRRGLSCAVILQAVAATGKRCQR